MLIRDNLEGRRFWKRNVGRRGVATWGGPCEKRKGEEGKCPGGKCLKERK